MKICTVCKHNKELKEFNKKNSTKDKLQSICRECSKKLSRSRYRNNTDSHKTKVKEWKISYRKKLKSIINTYKKECCICYEDFNQALDFHHINEKNISVGRACAKLKSESIIVEEIKKCIVLCSNCHRKYHANNFCLLVEKNIAGV